MDPEFWLARWQEQRIGFHLDSVNPWLQEFYPTWTQGGAGSVFVPLCGKSLDLAWLAGRGHEVIGNELSELAVEGFFEAQGLQPVRTLAGCLEWWQAGRIRLGRGDFFALEPADTATVEFVYDRAALIAMPAAKRPDYARQLSALSPAGSRMLLVTLEFDEARMDGPPFPVTTDEVHALYDQAFRVEYLGSKDCLEPRHRERGLRSMQEKAYILERHDAA